MSKHEKLVKRLLTEPRDFTRDELIKVLSVFGYTQIKKGKTGGSRTKFIDEQKNIISLHKPHPSNILKIYAIRLVILHLKEKGYMKDE